LKLKIVILTIALAALPALAQNAAPKKTLKVLKPEEVDPGRLLPPPDGSESQQKELAAEMNLVKTRTPERFQQAKWDANHEDPTAFASVIGPAFDLKKLPATSRLLEIALNEQSVIASAAKEYFHRKVPVVAAAGAVSNYQDWTGGQVEIDRTLVEHRCICRSGKGTWGNLWRNTLRAPGLFQFDTALSKKTRITARTAIELGLQVFNIFNHPQLYAPAANISSTSNFGRITSLVNSSPIGAGTPRQMQVTVRLLF
jgi:hypothetical protein